jgi:hypothetical protein|tara:strand:+ start:109 stop:357 length:249 start_codon:yes stop_codon:yes gene_type:complete
MVMSGIPNPINQMNEMALGMWSPQRSVIIDMIMVQLLSLIVMMVAVLMFRGGELSTNEATFFVFGLFSSLVFLSAVYARITQ